MSIVWRRKEHTLPYGMVLDGIHSDKCGKNIQLGKHIGLQKISQNQG
jgi:hypothetical protein